MAVESGQGVLYSAHPAPPQFTCISEQGRQWTVAGVLSQLLPIARHACFFSALHAQNLPHPHLYPLAHLLVPRAHLLARLLAATAARAELRRECDQGMRGGGQHTGRAGAAGPAGGGGELHRAAGESPARRGIVLIFCCWSVRHRCLYHLQLKHRLTPPTHPPTHPTPTPPACAASRAEAGCAVLLRSRAAG